MKKGKDTIAGKPKWKYWNDLRAKSKGLKKRKSPIKKSPVKKRAPGKSKKIPGLFEFFSRMIANCKWVCENCGQKCYTTDKKFQLAAQAHLLPKKTFPSVATIDECVVCMPAYGCGCHSAYDASWMRAKKLKSWPKFEKIILEKLIPRLTDAEYKKLPDFLKQQHESKTNTRRKIPG